MTPRDFWFWLVRSVRSTCPRPAPKPVRRQLVLDVLEDRTVPSTLSSLEVGPPALAPLPSTLVGQALADVTTSTSASFSSSNLDASTTALRLDLSLLTQPFGGSSFFPGDNPGSNFLVPSTLVISVLDSAGTLATDFQGTVNLWADPSLNLPSSYTFTAANAGRIELPLTVNVTATAVSPFPGAPAVVLYSLNVQTLNIVVADRSDFRVVAASELEVITSGLFKELGLRPRFDAPSQLFVGTPFNLPVLIVDANNNPFPTYQGTLRFTVTKSPSTTPEVVNLPGLRAEETYTLADGGTKHFAVTIPTAGEYSIVARDTANEQVTATVFLTVLPQETPLSEELRPRFDAPSQLFVGTPFTLPVRMVDATNKPFPTYQGTLRFTVTKSPSTTPEVVNLPGLRTEEPYTLADGGTKHFAVMIPTAGEYSIVATDTANEQVTATVFITVQPLPEGLRPAPTTTPVKPRKGKEFTVTVTMLADNAAVFAGYRGTIVLEPTKPLKNLPPTYTFQESDAGKVSFPSVKARFRGKVTLHVRDSLNPSIKGMITIKVV